MDMGSMYSSSSELVVGDIMSFGVPIADRDESIRSLAKKMKSHGSSIVVVLNRKTRAPIGIVTEGDIVKKLLSRKRHILFNRAKHAMSWPVITIRKDAGLEDAAERMVSNSVKSLCVVDDEERLLGLVTEDDVIRNSTYLIGVLKEMIKTSYATGEALSTQHQR